MEKSLSDSIQSVFDLTSRIDERLKIVIENYDKLEDKFDVFMESYSGTLQRIVKLESKNGHAITEKLDKFEDHVQKTVDKLEANIDKLEANIKELETNISGVKAKLAFLDSESKKTSSRWEKIRRYIAEAAILVAAGYILWSLGIK